MPVPASLVVIKEGVSRRIYGTSCPLLRGVMSFAESSVNAMGVLLPARVDSMRITSSVSADKLSDTDCAVLHRLMHASAHAEKRFLIGRNIIQKNVARRPGAADDESSATSLIFLGGMTRPGSKGIISVSVLPRHPCEKCAANIAAQW